MVPHARERRQYPRLQAPVVWRSPGLRALARSAVDVGLGGMRIYSDDRLRIGARLELELGLGEGGVMEVLARVVWVERLSSGAPARYDVGLEFLRVPQEGRSRLAEALGRGAP